MDGSDVGEEESGSEGDKPAQPMEQEDNLEEDKEDNLGQVCYL